MGHLLSVEQVNQWVCMNPANMILCVTKTIYKQDIPMQFVY